MNSGHPRSDRRGAGDRHRRQSDVRRHRLHRICNDCMKSCIYQKQEPVDIPQVETRTLKDVLALPWGFEIYSLLTRWNPLDVRRPLLETGERPQGAGGRPGPAGFTLAHHLMNDGHAVAGHRRAEDRTAGRGDLRRRRLRPAHAVPADPATSTACVEGLGERAMAGFRRRGRVRDHRALGQEFPEDGPLCCSNAAPNSGCTAVCVSAAP